MCQTAAPELVKGTLSDIPDKHDDGGGGGGDDDDDDDGGGDDDDEEEEEDDDDDNANQAFHLFKTSEGCFALFHV